MGEHEAVVSEVDPIRGQIKVTLATNVEVVVGPEELTTKKYEPEVPRKRKRMQKEAKAAPEPPEPEPEQRTQEEPAQAAAMNFEFSVFVKGDGVVLKIGSLCFVDSCSFPFIITQLFKSSLSGSVFVSGVRCVCEGGGGGSCFYFA